MNMQAHDCLLPYLRPGQVVSLENTTYPGTSEEELRPRIEEAGFAVGTDVFLVYSPEREDPGSARLTTRTIPKIVSGSTPACLAVGEALYGGVIDEVVPVRSTRVEQLRELGAQLDYCDPYFPVFPAMRRHCFDLASRELSATVLEAYDCVVVGTDHDVFDYELIFRAAPLVVDTRGRAKQRDARIFSA